MTKKKADEVAEDIMKEVLKRIQNSYKKYGDQYLLADIEQELDEEIYDIVGWPLLLAVRLSQISKGVVREMNNEYLDKFITRAKTPYLQRLETKIKIELKKREHSS